MNIQHYWVTARVNRTLNSTSRKHKIKNIQRQEDEKLLLKNDEVTIV